MPRPPQCAVNDGLPRVGLEMNQDRFEQNRIMSRRWNGRRSHIGQYLNWSHAMQLRAEEPGRVGPDRDGTSRLCGSLRKSLLPRNEFQRIILEFGLCSRQRYGRARGSTPTRLHGCLFRETTPPLRITSLQLRPCRWRPNSH